MRDLIDCTREIVSELLYLSNSAGSLPGYMKELTSRLSAWTGCEAVGVRLVDGEDFPYYETHGFSGRFVEMERSS